MQYITLYFFTITTLELQRFEPLLWVMCTPWGWPTGRVETCRSSSVLIVKLYILRQCKCWCVLEIKTKAEKFKLQTTPNTRRRSMRKRNCL